MSAMSISEPFVEINRKNLIQWRKVARCGPRIRFPRPRCEGIRRPRHGWRRSGALTLRLPFQPTAALCLPGFNHIVTSIVARIVTRPRRPLPGQGLHLLEQRTFARHTWTTTHLQHDRVLAMRCFYQGYQTAVTAAPLDRWVSLQTIKLATVS